MQKFSDPLDKIKIASPCGAKWNEMFGDDRRRHCAECRLNVYNISDMTRAEAESLLINAEGRVCLRMFRREDGTVLTQNCPVGWQKVKRHITRVASAAFTLIAAIFTGISAVKLSDAFASNLPAESTYKPNDESEEKISFGGMISNLPEIKADILKSRYK